MLRVVRKGFLEAEAAKLELGERKKRGECSKQKEQHVQRPRGGREQVAFEEPMKFMKLEFQLGSRVCGTSA